MSTFPSISAPHYPSKEKLVQRKITSTFENGIEFGRKTSTIPKREFELMWTSMSEADYQTLEAFFIAQGAEPFNWTDPATSTAYVVRFPQGQLDSSHLWNGRRSVSIVLHEIPNAPAPAP